MRLTTCDRGWRQGRSQDVCEDPRGPHGFCAVQALLSDATRAGGGIWGGGDPEQIQENR